LMAYRPPDPQGFRTRLTPISAKIWFFPLHQSWRLFQRRTLQNSYHATILMLWFSRPVLGQQKGPVAGEQTAAGLSIFLAILRNCDTVSWFLISHCWSSLVALSMLIIPASSRRTDDSLVRGARREQVSTGREPNAITPATPWPIGNGDGHADRALRVPFCARIVYRPKRPRWSAFAHRA